MSANAVKTVLLLGLLSALLVIGGGALGGRNGLYIGLAFAGFFFSDILVEAGTFTKLVPVPQNEPQPHEVMS